MAKKKKTAVIQEKTESSNFNSKRMKSFYAWDGDILVLNVLGTPSAKRDIIGKPKGNQQRKSPSVIMAIAWRDRKMANIEKINCRN